MTVLPGIYRKNFDTAPTYQYEFYQLSSSLSGSTVGPTQPLASTCKQETLNKFHLLNNV